MELKPENLVSEQELRNIRMHKEWIERLREYARQFENYEHNGWDLLIECWEEKDIVKYWGSATTYNEALVNITKIIELNKEQYDSVRSEIF